jgi:hypothetical protein
VTEVRERIIFAIAVFSVVGALAGLAGSVVWFSTAICVVIGLGYALGYAAHLGRWPVAVAVLATFSVMAYAFGEAAVIHEAGRPLNLVLGFPLQTTLFVWVIWPLGIVMCVLHAATFDKLLLPRETVENIVAEFGSRTDPE